MAILYVVDLHLSETEEYIANIYAKWAQHHSHMLCPNLTTGNFEFVLMQIVRHDNKKDRGQIRSIYIDR